MKINNMLNSKNYRAKSNRRRKRRGAVTVEMAFVLPVFLLILFGFVEVSRLYFAVNSTQVALIKSARELSLPNATAEDGELAAIEYLQLLGYNDDEIEVDVVPSIITPTTPEVTVSITLTMQPLPYPVRRELTRSRE